MDNKTDGVTSPPWLEDHFASLGSMIARAQYPQGLLIHGPPGTGRRYLGLWLASQLLRIPVSRLAHLAETVVGEEAEAELGHPDLMIVQPEPDKKIIAVEQIRDVTGFLQLKSHQGGARVVLCWPAESMNAAAANGLLKTLEEPPPGSAIILIAAAPGQVRPTVLSRCHRLRVSPPPADVALAWLATHDTSAKWDLLLDFAGGAPLQALALHRRGFTTQAQMYTEDLRQLRQRQDTPAAVAKRWANGDPELPLRWLYRQAARSFSKAALDQTPVLPTTQGNRLLQKPPKQRNMRPLLERLREVEELYRNRARAMSLDVQLTSLLQRWYGEVAGGDES